MPTKRAKEPTAIRQDSSIRLIISTIIPPRFWMLLLKNKRQAAVFSAASGED